MVKNREEVQLWEWALRSESGGIMLYSAGLR